MLKKEILRQKKDFQRIYRRGRSIADRYVVLFWIRNGLSYNRTAFLASKKVGNSVQRNRAKRLMKESWREYAEEAAQGYDIILIARNTINRRKCREVSASVGRSLRKSGLIARASEK